jgi:hypothetical protein
MSVSNRIIQELAVTAELCGTEMSAAAAQVMCAELEGYPEDSVLGALCRLRREHQGRLTLASIISRLDDGRPGAEEAWALFPKNEMESSPMTLEMQEAIAVASPLLEAGDSIAARMAFKETYERTVSKARADRVPVRWIVSLGFDKQGREPAISDAVRKQRITIDHAIKLLPVESHERFYESIGRNDLLLAHQSEINPQGIKRVNQIINGVLSAPEPVRQNLDETKKRNTAAIEQLKQLFK